MSDSPRCTSCGAMISSGLAVHRLVLKPFHTACQTKDLLSLQKFEDDRNAYIVALEAVLLFLREEAWTDQNQDTWWQMTGNKGATLDDLLDFVRETLKR